MVITNWIKLNGRGRIWYLQMMVDKRTLFVLIVSFSGGSFACWLMILNIILSIQKNSLLKQQKLNVQLPTIEPTHEKLITPQPAPLKLRYYKICNEKGGGCLFLRQKLCIVRNLSLTVTHPLCLHPSFQVS